VIGEGLGAASNGKPVVWGVSAYSKRFFLATVKLLKMPCSRRNSLRAWSYKQFVLSFPAEIGKKRSGSSGTARALADLLKQNDWSNEGITAEGLAKLRSMLLKAGECKRLDTLGLKPDRIPVLPGGFAIMSAVFTELNIQHMSVAGAAFKKGCYMTCWVVCIIRICAMSL